jgi:HlyD family secretion protein
VFTIDDGRSRLREVQVGQRNDLEAEIITGLSEGDRVILHPPDILTDDMKVTARATPSPAYD